MKKFRDIAFHSGDLFAVTRDLKLQKCEEIDKNIPCLFWLLLEFNGKTNTTSFGNNYKHYDYLFFDYLGYEFIVEKQGWKIKKIREGSWKDSFSPSASVAIVDPLGRDESFLVGKTNEEETAILESLELLDKFSDYPSFDNYHLHEKLNEVKKELSDLKKQIELLQNNIELPNP